MNDVMDFFAIPAKRPVSKFAVMIAMFLLALQIGHWLEAPAAVGWAGGALWGYLTTYATMRRR
jgi:hypothetical protein